ncbi:hypothetical protein PG984_006797 [Apiospora sp. TS-2023a]
MASKKPESAKAVWWDSSSVYVRCPECEKIHCHGFEGDYNVKHHRSSHCAQTRYTYYEIQFPFSCEEGKVNYEIDKPRALFVAGGEDPSEYFARWEDDQLPSLIPDFSTRPKWTDATELDHVSEETIGIPGGFTSKRIDKTISAIATGKVDFVRQYLDTSTDADILLHGVEAFENPEVPNNSGDDEDDTEEDGSLREDDVEITGVTALHLAACEQSSEVVKLLLERGADPNVIDRRGRTPLAEAAFWGRRENVELLLKHGADKDMQCYLCSGRVGKAIEFAKPLDENKEERFRRAGGEHQLYKEDTFQRDRNRKAIVRLLQDEGAEGLDQSNRNTVGFAFTNSPLDEHMLTLVAYFDIPNEWKTIGVMYRGSQFPTVAAMSGWSHPAGHEHNVQIAGRTWTDEVLRLCQIIGHELPTHDYDQKVLGQYHACHAEKQLVAYFVHKHIFLRQETYTGATSALEALANLSLGEPLTEGKREGAKKLSALKTWEPPISLKEAIIMVCRPICPDCESFVGHVNEKLGLGIKLRHRCVEQGCRLCGN